MFENLSERLSQAAKNLSGKGRITEDKIRDTVRQVRLALLEADVALPVVRTFIEHIRERDLGEEVGKRRRHLEVQVDGVLELEPAELPHEPGLPHLPGPSQQEGLALREGTPALEFS